METTTAQPTLIFSNETYELWDWSQSHTRLIEMLDREVDALCTVVNEDISFSTTTGSGIEGAQISCFRVLSHEPVLDGDWRESLPGDGAVVADRIEAKRFGLAMGYLLEYRRMNTR